MGVQSLGGLLQPTGDDPAGSWAEGSLLLSLHPDGSRVAVARGTVLCVCPLLPSADAEPISAEDAPPQKENEDDGDSLTLQDRRGTHTAAGPRSSDSSGAAVARRSPRPSATAAAAAPLPPLRFACPAASGPAVVCSDDITAMAWLAFARPPGAPGSVSPDRQRSGGSGVAAPGGGYRRNTSSGSGGGIFASIQAMLEDHDLARQQQQRAGGGGGGRATAAPHPGYSCIVLLCGTRCGCLQLHDADSGAVLLRQAMHVGPVLSIAVRTWRMGLKPDDAVEDVTMGWADAVVRLAAWDLRAAATTCYAAQQWRSSGGGGGAGGGGGSSQSMFGLWGSAAAAGPEVKPLAAQKWEVPAALRGRSCVVCVGQRPRDLYSLLQGIGSSTSTSSSSATGKTIFLAGGDRPACLAALEVDEQSSGGGGALSYIGSVASSVGSGVMGLARTARSVAAAPLTLGSGLRSFMLNPLQLAHNPSAAAGGRCGSGSADPALQPLASFADASAGQRLPATGSWRVHRDDGRTVLALAPAPHGSLVAAVDGLGRVLLVEAGQMLLSRMWKGYRDAQVAWLEVPVSCVVRATQRRRAQEAEEHRQQQREQQKKRGEDDGAAAKSLEVAPGEAEAAVTSDSGAGRPGSDASAAACAGSVREWRQTRGPLPTRSAHQPPLASSPTAPSALSAPHHPHLQPQNLLDPRSCGGSGWDGDGGESSGGEEQALLLVMYAPRRQTLELWWPLHGERLAALAAPPRARLLQRGGGGGGELGTWRVADAASAAAPPMTPAGCMLCSLGPAAGLGAQGMERRGGRGRGASGADAEAGLELQDVAALFGLY